MEGKKIIRKYSRRSFKNSKSTASHVMGTQNSSENSENFENFEETHLGVEDNCGVRQNLKKSWWVSGPKNQNVCPQCEKEFKSARALFGHMRCHSIKGEVKRKVVLGVNCGDQMPKPARKKRSERRYKISSNSSLSILNASQCVSDVDLELEEIAVCLLMLSKGGFCTVDEACSDDDSVNLESKMTIKDTRISKNDGDHLELGLKGVNSCDLGSGDVSNEEKIVGFCGFDCGFAKNDTKNDKFEVDVPDFELYDAEVKGESCTTALGCSCDLTNIVEVDQASLVMEGSDSRVHENDAEMCDLFHENTEHKCKICGKSFASRQALAGHKLHCPIYKRFSTSKVVGHGETSCTDIILASLKLENSENVVEEDVMKKRQKRHEYKCQECSKVFRSGKALGGHMRAHCASHSGSYPKEKDLTAKEDVNNADSAMEI